VARIFCLRCYKSFPTFVKHKFTVVESRKRLTTEPDFSIFFQQPSCRGYRYELLLMYVKPAAVALATLNLGEVADRLPSMDTPHK